MENGWFEYIIETGLIINAIVWDGEEPYSPGDGIALVPVGDSNAWIGWTYDGENFIPPEEPEEIVE